MCCDAGVARQGCQSHGFKRGVDVTGEGNSGFSWGDGFVRELYRTQLHRHVLKALNKSLCMNAIDY